MKNITKILAPAGSLDSLKAAVLSGADEIYGGYSAFSARSEAKNFTEEELIEGVNFCHLYGAKFYLAVNTLVKEIEVEELCKTLKLAGEIGVDAIIVQDIGVMNIIKKTLPGMKIHASTQMSITNLRGVQECERLGFSRVVLARELPITEIRHICENSNVEIEVFIHGALCMSYSGQCYFSAFLGGRSGNRGKCAQPCRLPYNDGYPLSLKDLETTRYISELKEIGVASLKIEGRMKRSEYVRLITKTYESLLASGEPPTEEEMENLATMFSRSGFTSGYLADKIGKGMFGIKINNENEEKYRKLLKQNTLESAIKNPVKRVGIKFSATIKGGQNIEITAVDVDGNSAKVFGNVPEVAINAPINSEKVAAQLGKVGGTPYEVLEIKCEIEEGLSLPLSHINELRRSVLLQIDEKRIATKKYEFVPYEVQTEKKVGSEKEKIALRVLTATQIPQNLKGIARVYLPLEEIEGVEGKEFECEIIPIIPRIYFTREEGEIVALLKRWISFGAKSALCGNIGAISLAKSLGLRAVGDYSLNIFSPIGKMEYAKIGLSEFTPSIELTYPQIKKMGGEMPMQIYVYGKMSLMITQNCVVEKSFLGCKKCEENTYLTDRMGEDLLVKSAFGCRNEMFNSHPVYLADKHDDYKQLKPHYIVLSFTDECASEIANIIHQYKGGYEPMSGDFTRGLYYKGVL